MKTALAAFEKCATPPVLGEDEIHVWWARASAADSPREIAAEARAILKRLLCAYAGIAFAPPIERGPHGKPFVPALPGLEFNLSHAGRNVLLAFARNQAVGVDLEQHDRRVSPDEIAKRYFAVEEVRMLQHLTDGHRRCGFLRLWTHKEAVLKALGDGLSFGLDRVEFALDGAGRVSGLQRIGPGAGMASAWNLRELLPVAGLIGALAWCGPYRDLRAFEWIP